MRRTLAEQFIHYFTPKKRIAIFMVAPTMLVLLLFAIYPLIFMFGNSFRAWQLTSVLPPKFVWFKTFGTLFSYGRYWNAFANTLILLAIGILVQSVLGLGIAMLLNRQFHGKRILTGLFLVPVMIVPVVSGTIWRLMLNSEFGPFNYLLGITVHWLGVTKAASMTAILMMDTWQWTPFVAMVLLAGLSAIPREVYEAADVDSASGWHVFTRVTLPLLRPIFGLVVLLRTIFIFRIYEPVSILTAGGPGSATESLSLLTYRTGFQFWNIGLSSAMSVIQVIFMILVAYLFLKFVVTGGRTRHA